MPEVTELAWILATVTGMGLLERATSYKDKVDQRHRRQRRPVHLPGADGRRHPHLPLATSCPVGKDQVQHLEMTRDMAGYFNNGVRRDVFPLPAERLDEAPTVPGTDGQKMSQVVRQHHRDLRRGQRR